MAITNPPTRGRQRRNNRPPTERLAAPPHAIFFTVETLFLQRLYVLFFVSLERRRVEHLAVARNPTAAWVTQQARNIVGLAESDAPRPRFLIHDRDSKFSRSFDDVFRSEGTTILRTPLQAPNANAYAERWVRTVRNDCLDRLLILGRRQLEHVLRVYVQHYNAHRPHRSLDLRPPTLNPAVPAPQHAPLREIQRRDLLAGLVHEYATAA